MWRKWILSEKRLSVLLETIIKWSKSMKKLFVLFIVFVICITSCGCSNSDYYGTENVSTSDYQYSSNSSKYEYNYLDDDDDNDYSYFSNKYGSSTTKCAKSGCSNYIAKSGDTAYCTAHSNKCLECYCYIDGDAMYCMKCLTSAASKVKNDYKSNDYSHECYVCGEKAYSKYGSYYYCSSCLAIVKAFS